MHFISRIPPPLKINSFYVRLSYDKMFKIAPNSLIYTQNRQIHKNCKILQRHGNHFPTPHIKRHSSYSCNIFNVKKAIQAMLINSNHRDVIINKIILKKSVKNVYSQLWTLLTENLLGTHTTLSKCRFFPRRV